MKQSTELAWDVTDWDNDADLSESNVRHNLEHTFLSNGLILPASIVCRIDQENHIKEWARVLPADETHIQTIDLGYGAMKLKVLPLVRKEITYTKAVQ